MRTPDHIKPREHAYNITQEAKQGAHRAQVALEALIYGYSDQLTIAERRSAQTAKMVMQDIVTRLRGRT